MQYFVTCKTKKSRQKSKAFFCVLIIILVLFLVFIFGIALFFKSKQNKEFLEQRFYFVCATKSKNVKELENMQDEIKNLGGAGKIYNRDNINYLIINVYLEEESAKSVLKQNIEKFPSAEILELKTKIISRKRMQKLKNVEEAYMFLKEFNFLIKNSSQLMIDYLNSDVSENDLCSELLTVKFDFDDINVKISKIFESETKSLVQNYTNLTLMYFSNFFNSFFGSDKKYSIVCEFVVNLALLKIDFFNNL